MSSTFKMLYILTTSTFFQSTNIKQGHDCNQQLIITLTSAQLVKKSTSTLSWGCSNLLGERCQFRDQDKKSKGYPYHTLFSGKLHHHSWASGWLLSGHRGGLCCVWPQCQRQEHQEQPPAVSTETQGQETGWVAQRLHEDFRTSVHAKLSFHYINFVYQLFWTFWR